LLLVSALSLALLKELSGEAAVDPGAAASRRVSQTMEVDCWAAG